MDFDRCKLRNACQFILSQINFTHQSLDVPRGTPAIQSKTTEKYTQSDFINATGHLEKFERIEQLISLRGLLNLEVKGNSLPSPTIDFKYGGFIHQISC